MRVLININEPEKELNAISDDVGVTQKEFGFVLHANTKEPLQQYIALRESSKNYKWIEK